jgi:ATP-binding cassette subfamily F protein 3
VIIKNNKKKSQKLKKNNKPLPPFPWLTTPPIRKQKFVFQEAGSLSARGLISAEHVSFKYDTTIVLEDVCLDLNSDSKIALVGANGSGKSTLLKLCANELFPLREPSNEIAE